MSSFDDNFAQANPNLPTHTLVNSGSTPVNSEIIIKKNPGSSEKVLKQSASPAASSLEILFTNKEKGKEPKDKYNQNILKTGNVVLMSGWYARSDDYDGRDSMLHSRLWSNARDDGNNVLTQWGLGYVSDKKTIDGLDWEHRYTTLSIPYDWKGTDYNWYLGYPAGSTKGNRYFADLRLQLVYHSDFSSNVKVGRIKHAKEGGEPGWVEIVSDFPAPAGGLAVQYEISGGTATRDLDYYSPKLRINKDCIKNIVKIPENSQSAKIYLTAIDDGLIEGNEDIKLNIVPNIYPQCSRDDNPRIQYEIADGNAVIKVEDNVPDFKNAFARKFNPIDLFSGKRTIENTSLSSNILTTQTNPLSNTALVTNAGSSIISMKSPSEAGITEQQNVLKQTKLSSHQIQLTTELKPKTTYVLSGWYAQNVPTLEAFGFPDQPNSAFEASNHILQFYSPRYSEAQKTAYIGEGRIFGGSYTTAAGPQSIPIGMGKLLERRYVNGISWEHRYLEIEIPEDYVNQFTWDLGKGNRDSGLGPGEIRYYTGIKIEPKQNSILNKSNATIIPNLGFGNNANDATMSRDLDVSKSPSEGIPLKMVTTGSDPYTLTYGNNFDIVEAKEGETWTASVYAKSDKKIQAFIEIYDTVNKQTILEPIDLTKRWQRHSVTISDLPSDTQLQLKLKGGKEQNSTIWWDGIQVEKGDSPTAFQNFAGAEPGISITTKNKHGVAVIRSRNDSNNIEKVALDVHINSKPLDDVIVNLNATSGDLNNNQLIFTPSNWKETQRVTLTNISKLKETTLTSVTSSNDKFYQDLTGNQLIVPSKWKKHHLIDLKENGYENTIENVRSVHPINGKEGENKLGFEFSINQKSKSDTIVKYTLNHDDAFILSGNNADIKTAPQPDANNSTRYSVTIPAGKYNTLLSLPSVDDNLDEDNERISVSLVPSFNNTEYQIDSNAGSATATLKDNDTSDIDFMRSVPNNQDATNPSWAPFKRLVINEGATQEINLGLKLTTRPSANVELTLDQTKIAGKLNSTTGFTYTFTTQNWNEVQEVKFTIVDDNEIDKLKSISFDIKTDDPKYQKLNQNSLALPVIWNDNELDYTESREKSVEQTNDYSKPLVVLSKDSITTLVEETTETTPPNEATKSTYTLSLKSPDGTQLSPAEKDTTIFLETNLVGRKRNNLGYIINPIKTSNGEDITLKGLSVLDLTSSSHTGYDTNGINETNISSDKAINKVWEGYLSIPETGQYSLILESTGQADLDVGGKILVNPVDNATNKIEEKFIFEAGEYVPIRVKFNPKENNNQSISLQWQRPVNGARGKIESIPASFFTPIGQTHFVIPKGESNIQFTVDSVADKIANPTEYLSLNPMIDRKELIEIKEIINNSSGILESLNLQLSDQSTRESFDFAKGTLLDFGLKSSATKTAEVKLEQDITIFKGIPSTVKVSVDNSSDNQLKKDMVASSDHTYQVYDHAIRLNLKEVSPAKVGNSTEQIAISLKNIGNLSTTDIAALSKADKRNLNQIYNVELAYSHQSNTELVVPKGTHIGLVSKNLTGTNNLSIKLRQDLRLPAIDTNNQNDQQTVSVQINSDLVGTSTANINNINNVEQYSNTMNVYDLTFSADKSNLTAPSIPKGTRLDFRAKANSQKNIKTNEKDFSIVLYEDLNIVTSKENTSTPVNVKGFGIDVHQSSVGQQPVANQSTSYQIDDANILSIKDNDTAGLVYSKLSSDGQNVAFNSNEIIQLAENGNSELRYVKLLSQPTKAVTLYLESADTSEVQFKKGYQVLSSASLGNFDGSTVDFEIKPKTTTNQDFIKQAIIRMNQDESILAFAVTYTDATKKDIKAIEFKNSIADASNQPNNRTWKDIYSSGETFKTLEGMLGRDAKPADSRIRFTFDSTNWDIEQPFNLVPMNDNQVDSNVDVNIYHRLVSDDSEYQDITPYDINREERLALRVENRDDDKAGLVIDQLSNEIGEDKNGYIKMSLSAEPQKDVKINLKPFDDQFVINDLQTKQSDELVFTQDNYNVSQTVKLSAVDDDVVEDLVRSELIISSNSEDKAFDASLDIEPVYVDITDDDVPEAILVLADNGTENAEPGRFRVKLSAPAPVSAGSKGITVNYTIDNLKVSDAFGPNTLGLSQTDIEDYTQNLSTSGSVTIRPGEIFSDTFVVPIDDAIADSDPEDKQFNITLNEDIRYSSYSLSSDNTKNSATIKIINDDKAGVAIVHSGQRLPAFEGAGKPNSEYSISLLSQPTNTVTFSVSEDPIIQDQNQIESITSQATGISVMSGEVGASTIKFTPDNWNIPQKIEINAKEDSFIEDGFIDPQNKLGYIYQQPSSESSDVPTVNSNNSDGSTATNVTALKTGIHPTRLLFNFTSNDPDYSSLNEKSFTHNLKQDVEIYDQELPDSSADSLNRVLSSMQNSINDFNLPMIGNSDKKIGGSYDSFSQEIVENVRKESNLSPNKLESIIEESMVKFLNLPSSQPTSRKKSRDISQSADDNVNVKMVGDEINVNFKIDDSGSTIIPLNSEFGVPELGFKTEGNLNAEYSVDGALDMYFPSSNLPYIKTDPDNTYFKANIKANLDKKTESDKDFEIIGSLGGLQIKATNQKIPFNDKNEDTRRAINGSDAINQEGPSTNLNINLEAYADNDMGAGADDKLTLLELRTNPEISDLFRYETPNSKAVMSFDVESSISENAAIPKFKFDLAANLPITDCKDDDPNCRAIFVDDVRLDLGTFVKRMADPVVGQINEIFSPIYPIVDALNADTHLFTKIGIADAFDQNNDNKVSVLELVEWFAMLSEAGNSKYEKQFNDAKEFLNDVNTITSLVRELEQMREQGSYEINFGNFHYDFGTKKKLGPSNEVTEECPKDSKTLPADDPKAQALNDGKNGSNPFKSVMQKLDELGFEIDLIDNSTETLLDILVGTENINLFTWTVSDSDAEACNANSFNVTSSVSESFPMGPIDGVIEGGFGAKADLSFGFNTRGVNQWKESGFSPSDSWKVINGFYVNDRKDSNGDGEVTGADIDIPELSINANMGAGVSLDAFIAKASVTGGVEATANLDLLDEGEIAGNSDGKIYTDEITSRIENPLSLFEMVGELAAYLKAAVQVGINFGFYSYYKTVWERELARIPIFKFEVGGYGGVASNGYLDDSTIFFDANKNGWIDNNEPSAQTDENGYFNLDIDHRAFDTNYDGKLDQTEGYYVAIGGVDVTTGLPIDIPFIAPPGSIITPLTTIHTMAVEQGYSEEHINKIMQNVLGIGDFDYLDEDPMNKIRNTISLKKAGNKDKLATYLSHSKVHFGLDILANGLDKLSEKHHHTSHKNMRLTRMFTKNLMKTYGDGDSGDNVQMALIETALKRSKKVNPITEESIHHMASFMVEALTWFDEETDNLLAEKRVKLKEINKFKSDIFNHYNESMQNISSDLHDIASKNKKHNVLQERFSNAHNSSISNAHKAIVEIGTEENDLFVGASQDNIFYGNPGDDTLKGKNGSDKIKGGTGNDELYGNKNNDLLIGNIGQDLVRGNQGDDNLYGGPGSDSMHGNSGNDFIKGQKHNDNLFGGLGKDTLHGGAGDDLIDGGFGNDESTGGRGADQFKLSPGKDTIKDFNIKQQDRILLGNIEEYELRQSGSNLVIKFEGENETILAGIDKAVFETKDLMI